jgi:hypothetical protein
MLVGSPVVVVVGDFNGDAKMDLAVALSRANQLVILLGDGQSNFQMSASYDANGSPTSLVVADLNGDRNQDLAVAAGTEAEVLLGNGDGTFQLARY